MLAGRAVANRDVERRLTSWTANATASECLNRIFERITDLSHAPSMSDVHGVLEFDLGQAGQWFVDLRHDSAKVTRMASHADCRIICTPGDWIAVAQGRTNLLAAYLRGDVHCVGDIAAAMALRHVVALIGDR